MPECGQRCITQLDRWRRYLFPPLYTPLARVNAYPGFYPQPQEHFSLTSLGRRKGIWRTLCNKLSFRISLPKQGLTFCSAQVYIVRNHPWKCPSPPCLVDKSIWFNNKVWASPLCHRLKAMFSNPAINSNKVEMFIPYLYNFFCFNIMLDSEIRHMERSVVYCAHITQIIGTQY